MFCLWMRPKMNYKSNSRDWSRDSFNSISFLNKKMAFFLSYYIHKTFQSRSQRFKFVPPLQRFNIFETTNWRVVSWPGEGCSPLISWYFISEVLNLLFMVFHCMKVRGKDISQEREAIIRRKNSNKPAPIWHPVIPDSAATWQQIAYQSTHGNIRNNKPRYT